MGSPKTALIGLGNPYHGDDAIGLIVARHLHRKLPATDLLELSTCGFGVMEHLVGYERAVIIDALVDGDADVGTIRSMPLSEQPCAPSLSFHTVGFEAALGLARLLGMAVPRDIAVFGIVIPDPWSFGIGLSAQLEAALPGIIREFVALIGARLCETSPDLHLC